MSSIPVGLNSLYMDELHPFKVNMSLTMNMADSSSQGPFTSDQVRRMSRGCHVGVTRGYHMGVTWVSHGCKHLSKLELADRVQQLCFIQA